MVSYFVRENEEFRTVLRNPNVGILLVKTMVSYFVENNMVDFYKMVESYS